MRISSATVGDLHKERYRIGGKPVDCTVNWTTGELIVQTYGFTKTVPVHDFEIFPGNMEAFAEYLINQKGD